MNPRKRLSSQLAAHKLFAVAILSMVAAALPGISRADAIPAPSVSGGTISGGSSLASINAATGTASTSIAFEAPKARGLAQPELALTYDSTMLDDGVGGRGWSLSVPAITRRSATEGPGFMPGGVVINGPSTAKTAHNIPVAQDRYAFGGRDLVLICTSGSNCTLNRQEVLPDWSSGWRYFRLQNDDSYARFFLDPTSATWRVEFKDGQIWEFGAPTVGVGPGFNAWATDTEPRTNQPYRWALVRKFDLSGGVSNPVNIVAYQWASLGESPTDLLYLTDVYDTPGAGLTTSAAGYAHHVHLSYALPTSYAPATNVALWRSTPHRRLTGVDVTSYNANAGSTSQAAAARSLVRRYHFAYQEIGNHSYLQSAQMEGRCSSPPIEPIPAVTSCGTLPAMTFSYSAANVNTTAFELKTSTIPLAGGSNPFAAIVDVDGDGLPDVVQQSGNQLALHFNTVVSGVVVNGVPSFSDSLSTITSGPATAGTLLSRSNDVSVPMDVGLGSTSSIFWFPGSTTWCPNTPEGGAFGSQMSAGNCETNTNYVPNRQPSGSWSWEGLADGSHWADEWHGINYQPGTTDMESQCCESSANRGAPGCTETCFLSSLSGYQLVGDLDGDGLADVLSLGQWVGNNPYRGVDPFSAYYRTTRDTAGHYSAFSTFSQSIATDGIGGNGGHSVLVADANGDHMADIVDVDMYDGQFFYYPFNGADFSKGLSSNGYTVDFSSAVTVSVPKSLPLKTAVQGYAHDVNGDGLLDVLLATPSGIVVNFSKDTVSLDPNGIVTVPWSQFGITYDKSGSPWQISFADMNGSGVDDLVVLTQAGRLFYVDFVDGVPNGWANRDALVLNSPSAPRPGLLLAVSNGLGAFTEITYGSTADEQRQATFSGHPWASVVPFAQTVALRTETYSGVGVRRSALYSHRDPIYDPWSHGTLGFQQVSTTIVGDTNEPSSVTDVTYVPVSGGCTGPCLPGPVNEAAPPVPILIEKHDANGVYLSTTHIGYQQNYIGVSTDGDNRTVQSFTPEVTETLLYETNGQKTGTGSISSTGAISNTFTANVFQNAGGVYTPGTVVQGGTIHPRAATYTEVETQTYRDWAGNVSREIDLGQVSAPGTSAEQGIATTSAWKIWGSTWSWRVIQQTAGTTNPDGTAAAPSRVMSYGYDPLGRLTSESSVLTGTTPLVRTPPTTGAAVAPQPPNAAANGSTIVLVTYGYDQFGNVTSIAKPNGRCVSYQYSDTYAQFPDVESVGCAGTPPLSTLQFFDWAFGIAIGADGPGGTDGVISLDEFGRAIKIIAPDPVTGLPSKTVATVDYPTTVGGPFQAVHVVAAGSETWTYVDGLGESYAQVKRASDTAAIVSNVVLRNAKGHVQWAYQPWVSSSLGQPPSTMVPPSTTFEQTQYDAFGRVTSQVDLDGKITGKTTYHPFWKELYSAADVDGTRKAGPSSIYYDGHGRTIRQVTPITNPTSDVLTTTWVYAPTGEVNVLMESHANSDSSAVVARMMQYDSLGRMVSNHSPDHGTWLYAYDAAGDLVGTSDARGCGKNIFYDPYGRVQGEDYSPCTSTQPAYSGPTLVPGNDGLWYLASSGAGAEVFNTYDAPEGGQTGDFGPASQFLVGHLAAVRDRGAHTRFGYDARGRMVSIARQLATPTTAAGQPSNTPYAEHWFRKAISYDNANRVVRETTGADDSMLFGMGDPTNDGASGGSAVTYGYDPRGTIGTIAGSYGGLVSYTKREPDGRLDTALLYDPAHTTESFTYYANRRLLTHTVQRAGSGPWVPAGASWYTPPSSTDDKTLQADLIDNTFGYDSDGNPSSITDGRNAGEWPPGAQPIGRAMLYDDLGQLSRVTYDSKGDAQKQAVTLGARFPGATLPLRVQWQTFTYDWLGTLSTSSDDASAFFDRSLGTTTPNTVASHQFAGFTSTTSSDKTSVSYDAAGNVSLLSVAATAEGAGTFQIVYQWDEVGQLMRARRTHPVASSPTGPTGEDVDTSYAYSEGSRVLSFSNYKIRYTGPNPASRFSARVFSSLRLNGIGEVFDTSANDYVGEQTAYLAGLARVLYETANIPSSSDGKLHVFYDLSDEIGSTSAVIDKDTSELVERSTYLAFGGTESDYQPSRWASFHEDYRFTGADSDEEVGLAQMGARYYSPVLHRWLSPDPLTVHGVSGDLNPYRYVGNSPLRFVDPTGLDGEDGCLGAEICPKRPYNPVPDDVVLPFPTDGASVQKFLDNVGNFFGIGNHNSPPTPPSPQISKGPGAFGLLSANLAHSILYSDNPVALFLQSDQNLLNLQNGIARGVISFELAAGIVVGAPAAYGAGMELAKDAAIGTRLFIQTLSGAPALITGGGVAVGTMAASPMGQVIEEKAPEVANEAIAVTEEVGETVVEEVESFAADAHPTFRPGPYAGGSIPARSSDQTFNTAERAANNLHMAETGCHTCSIKDPGTVSGNAILDHQPVSALNFNNAPQRLYPQCLQCSTDQGLAVARALAALKRSQ
ncbi:MAG TPA: RHS repeat-associated core domain-containing protein [Polyangiaceae bacterium]